MEEENVNTTGNETMTNDKSMSAKEAELEQRLYDRLIDRLKDERERLERDARHEYRNARRYVRANPEEGLGIAVLSGLMIGFLLGRSSKR